MFFPDTKNLTPNTLSHWLFACCGLVFAMVIIGAITRLTESGLSITEWKPLMGAIPPLNDAEWNRVFDLYKQSPEFEKKNFWMTLPDFKAIYFWEWLHRLLGRLIGLAYAIPLLWFWMRKQIPQGYHLKLLGVLVLGGLQGVIGWYMVKSGLVDRPDVSHFRLAAHLLLAFAIYAAMLWLGLSLRKKEKPHGDKALFSHGMAAFVLLCVTICWGAFTAGLDAGLMYNDSFPLMGGQWLPPELWALQPGWLNFVENHAVVQFAHRWLAIASVIIIVSFWLHAYAKKISYPGLHVLLLMAFVQAGLGIATLFSQVWLPLAVLHQAGGLMLFTLLLVNLHRLRN